ncbi:MAG: DUF1553 domain-containing protein [Pirellulaceae bacterium]|nr:DUF1553 domain-containing protein [Pirellulaceae bacterium]
MTWKLIPAALLTLLAPVVLRAQGADDPTAEQVAYFENHVRPLLSKQCYRCHGPKKQNGDLRLDSRAAILRGGESGAAITPGKPPESLLVMAVKYEELEMPPDVRLHADDVDKLVKWVALGAPWPDEGEVILKPRKPGLQITDDDRKHWAFRPIRRPPLPSVTQPKWVRNSIDRFVLAQLESRELAPNDEATRRELARRLYFDVLGIPPTFAEVEEFISSDQATAFEDLVDRLLASPRYGERWGRHWLDVVRYAQSNGYERDDEKPLAWMFRDYVIRSFNQDKGFDQFAIEQLAGDQLDVKTDDSLIATAYYHLGPWDDEPADKRQAEWDELDDIVSATGAAFLGLTIGCARCHDHKFDPIRQEDYYQLTAFVRNIRRFGKDKSETHYEPNKDAITVALPSGGVALGVKERTDKLQPTRVLIRGDSGNPAKEVEPAFPLVLSQADANGPPNTRRRRLAEWIAHADNPLTSRVIVNRVWHYHFGRGLAASPSDLGRTGTPPSHPKLLDWLAVELIEHEWSLKHLHRMVLTSATYRQSSRIRNERAVAIDPDNALLWRQNMRRLEAEAIRDAVLHSSGLLSFQMGGQGVFPTLPPEVLATQSRPGKDWHTSPEHDQARRSVYLFIKRTLGVPFIQSFDGATPDTPEPDRSTTTIAPQALILLNSAFMQRQATAMVERLLRETDGSDRQIASRCFEIALARQASADELSAATSFLQRQKSDAGSEKTSHYVSFCKLVLNLNEFVYID